VATIKRWLILGIIIIGGGLLALTGIAQANGREAVESALQENLTQVRTYADSDPGNYGYAKYIRRIHYRGGNRCTIQVSPEFKGLSAADRTSVINQTQALAKMVLVDQGARTKKQVRAGLVVTIRAGRQTLGRSRPSQHYHYSWTH
jgi:hypothetical protein